jgi:hypothetical protein
MYREAAGTARPHLTCGSTLFVVCLEACAVAAVAVQIKVERAVCVDTYSSLAVNYLTMRLVHPARAKVDDRHLPFAVVHAQRCVHDPAKNASFLSAFPMFDPSLSWYNDHL